MLRLMDEKLLDLIDEHKKLKKFETGIGKRWLLMFYELHKFKSRHGHTCVPAKYVVFPSLGPCSLVIFKYLFALSFLYILKSKKGN